MIAVFVQTFKNAAVSILFVEVKAVKLFMLLMLSRLAYITIDLRRWSSPLVIFAVIAVVVVICLL